MKVGRTVLILAALAAVAVVGGVSRDAGAAYDAAAAATPVEMNFACALKSNGLMRYVTNLNQRKKTEEKVTIKPGPITVCVNPDGTVRKIPPYQCTKPGVVLTLPPASGTVYFCVSNSTSLLRYVTSPSQCTASEFPVMVTPNAGKIIVKKVTDPSSDTTSFSFTAGGGLSPSSFNLKNGEQQTFSDVVPGSYNVTESVPLGWDLTSSTCDDGSSFTNIVVGAGETVTCTFADRQRGTIIVKKVTNPSPDPSDTSFPFTAGGGLSPSSFNLKNGQQQTYSNVLPGSSYSVSETVPSGWVLTSSTCDDGSSVSNIGVGAGETVTCTFTDTANQAPTDIQLSNSSIAENQTPPVNVGTLTTTDPDAGDTHTYTLENTGCGGGPFPDNSSFQIGGVSNDKLQSAASFDFETKSSYTVCVRSTDSGGLSFDKQFTISVTNVNEPPTDITLSNNSIDENKPSGSLVGNLSQVGDPDSGETYTFTLLTSGCSGSFPDSSNFQISGSQLQSAVSFNYEDPNHAPSYTICVRVNDPGSPNLSFEKQFTIAINNVNDPPVDGNESVSAVGNTLLEYGSVPSPSSAPKKVVSGNLLANASDEDQPPQTLSISSSDTTSAQGGDVSGSSSGAFSYVPKAGFTGTDTFHYTVTDGNGRFAPQSTVTITVASRVWYVKNNAT